VSWENSQKADKRREAEGNQADRAGTLPSQIDQQTKDGYSFTALFSL
jgi:hypothetical protein